MLKLYLRGPARGRRSSSLDFLFGASESCPTSPARVLHQEQLPEEGAGSRSPATATRWASRKLAPVGSSPSPSCRPSGHEEQKAAAAAAGGGAPHERTLPRKKSSRPSIPAMHEVKACDQFTDDFAERRNKAGRRSKGKQLDAHKGRAVNGEWNGGSGEGDERAAAAVVGSERSRELSWDEELRELSLERKEGDSNQHHENEVSGSTPGEEALQPRARPALAPLEVPQARVGSHSPMESFVIDLQSEGTHRTQQAGSPLRSMPPGTILEDSTEDENSFVFSCHTPSEACLSDSGEFTRVASEKNGCADCEAHETLRSWSRSPTNKACAGGCKDKIHGSESPQQRTRETLGGHPSESTPASSGRSLSCPSSPAKAQMKPTIPKSPTQAEDYSFAASQIKEQKARQRQDPLCYLGNEDEDQPPTHYPSPWCQQATPKPEVPFKKKWYKLFKT